MTTEPVRPWHAEEASIVRQQLETTDAGLSDSAVRVRLERWGANQLQEVPPPNALTILLHQFQSPLIYILLVAGAVTLALGHFIDAGVIGAVMVLNAIIGFTQERQAEVSVRALMKLVAPRARVIRNGREREVASAELVPGDLVLLESGARVPADLRLVSANSLSINESLLTGESLSVHKRTQSLPETASLADRSNMAFTGTVVASGRGRGVVVATGLHTELGKIAGSIRTQVESTTPLEERMNRFSKLVGLVVAAAACVGFGLGVWTGQPASEMFMVAVSLAVAAVPEGLPVVLTVTLAVGVRRMAARRAIIRKLPAIETLGSTTVIGSDKTGTLTENRMTVRRIWAGGKELHFPAESIRNGEILPVPDAVEPLAEHHPLYLTLVAAVLANEADLFEGEAGIELRGDPTETALLVAAERMGLHHESIRARYEVFADIPFEPGRQYSATICDRDQSRWVFVKGAPERVMSMCRDMLTDEGLRPLDEQTLHRTAVQMAEQGLRVLAMAYRSWPRPDGPTGVSDPTQLTFLGLAGMMDPPRSGVREAIAGCLTSGIRVVMITGDHRATAQAIGSQLGLDARQVRTGEELTPLDDSRLQDEVQKVSIFARVAPEQKLRVVKALQATGEVVAVTGDGVNDAPALKAADIGVAMGRSGTDVAREASDMVLADDNFVSIYGAVEEGRITFDNLRKVTFFLISTGAAAIVLILFALAAGWPLPLLPAQLLWLNLVTNGLQDVALAFEPGDKHVLVRPPRKRSEGFISRLLWERTVLSGLVMAAGTLFIFQWELGRGASLALAQTAALTTMVFFQMFQVGNARSEHQSVFAKSPFSNRFLFIATLSALGVHLGALFLPPTQFVLRVVPITDWQSWMRMLGVALSLIVVVELHKRVRRPHHSHPAASTSASGDAHPA